MTLILVLIAISILILVHEWGHFYSARKLGIKVEEFAIGFPPRIWSKVKNGIKYSVNILPLGGYVKIFGEHGEGESDKTSFAARPAWQRFIVLAAGVFMNLLLAWVIFGAVSVIGQPAISDNPPAGTPVSVIAIIPGSPAENADIHFGDKINKAVFSTEIAIITEEEGLQKFVKNHEGKEITLQIERNGESLEKKITPRVNYPENEGPMGVALARVSIEKTPWYLAPWEGLKVLISTTIATITGFALIIKELIAGNAGKINVSGPVGIYTIIGDTRSLGIAYFLRIIGIISVNLAVLNFLPIPALDGGRVLFLFLEKIRGRRVNPNWENTAHALGFALLIILMALVTYKDIVNVF